MKTLTGKTALITGASRGIGTYIARTLAGLCVRIIAVARSSEGLNDICDTIKSEGGYAKAIPFDLAYPEKISELTEIVKKSADHIDILINNAGIERYLHYQDYSSEQLNAILNINLHSPMELTRILLPDMLKNGGHIVNIASLAGKKGIAFNSIYSATKSGLIMWTDAMRQELKETNVNISVICPGYISDAGMFYDSHAKPPVMLGTSHPQKVADAVVKSIQKNKAELIVNSGPMKPLLALAQILPRLGDRIVNGFGVNKLNRNRAQTK